MKKQSQQQLKETGKQTDLQPALNKLVRTSKNGLSVSTIPKNDIKNAVMVQATSPNEFKLPSLVDQNRSDQSEVQKMILRSAMYLGVYYPDMSDYYTSESFVEVFREAIVTSFPNLLCAEIEFAIKDGMKRYQYHTFPKINDLIDLIHKHNEERIVWREEALHNKKLEYENNGIHDSILSIYKSAQKEAEKELQAERDKRRKIEKAESFRLKELNKSKMERLGIIKKLISYKVESGIVQVFLEKNHVGDIIPENGKFRYRVKTGSGYSYGEVFRTVQDVKNSIVN